jgi:hypothetical protein
LPAAHAADTGTAADPRSRKRKRAAPKEDGRTKNREKENIESARGLLDIFRFMQQKNELTFINSFLVGEGGFEPPKSLTTDLQSAPFGHSGIPPYEIVCLSVELVDGFEPPTC